MWMGNEESIVFEGIYIYMNALVGYTRNTTREQRLLNQSSHMGG
jgi:hypothetical protein